jgi:hypothetical protein
MTQSQLFALMHTLSDFPDGKTYKQIQKLVKDQHHTIAVWEMMEDWAVQDLFDYQDELEKSVRELAI